MSEREQILERLVQEQDILIAKMQVVIDDVFAILQMLKPRLSAEEAAALERAVKANEKSTAARQLQPILDVASEGEK